MSATSAINATEGEAGANARPSGAGRTSDGQGQQPHKSAGGQSHAAAGDGRAGAAAPRAGQVEPVSEVRLSVFVDRQAEAKTAAALGEEAEGDGMAAATDGGGVGGDRRRSRRGSLALPPSSIKQQQAERTERTEQQGRAFVALAHVVADAGGGGWPESMTRELQACRTPQERNAWAEKWGGYLSGQAEREKRGAPERPRGQRRAARRRNSTIVGLIIVVTL